MTTKILCETTEKGIHSFYLLVGNEKYFLFSQAYRKGVNEFYRQGVPLDESINYAKAHYDSAIIRTMDKIPKYIEYVEKFYHIEVLRKTRKRNAQRYKLYCA